MLSQLTYFGQERDLGGCLKLGGTNKSGSCHCCCKIEVGLVVESSGNTLH